MKRGPSVRGQRRSPDSTPLRNDSLRGDSPPTALVGRGAENVASLERVISVIGGGALALYGARRRGASGAALAVLGGALVHRGATGRCVVYDALGVSTRAPAAWLRKQHGGAAVLEASEAVRVEDTITISAPVAALYRHWRDPANLAEVVHFVQGGTATEREIRGTLEDESEESSPNLTVEIINDIPNRLVAWKTDAGATIPSAGSVHFEPAADGTRTVVRIVLEYLPAGGPFGALLLRLINGDPAPRLRRDLSRFRATMESRHLRSAARRRSR